MLEYINIHLNYPNTLTANQGLAIWPFSDKVLHVEPKVNTLCNTLSGGGHAAGKTHLSFCPAIVLDDQAACCGHGIFSTFNQEIPQRSRLLQQLYSQREVVHFTYNPSLRSRRDLVLRRDWLFTGRQLNQHAYQAHHSKPGRDDVRATWGEAALSLSFCSGSAVPPRKTATTKAGTFIHLSGCGFLHSSFTASSTGKQKHTQNQTPRRNCGVDSGGVYPSSRSQLRTAGHCDYPSPSYHSQCRANQA